jgi:hypothetical protein
MRKQVKWLLLSSVLCFYALLYLATQKKCDDECQKLKAVDRALRSDAAVYNTYQCGTAMLCVHVYDTLNRDWNNTAATACSSLNNEGLQHYKVYVVGRTHQDTLARQTCP